MQQKVSRSFRVCQSVPCGLVLCALVAATPSFVQADKQQPALRIAGPLTTATIAGPAWASNLPIYEVNLDLYGFPRGTALRAYCRCSASIFPTNIVVC